MNVITTTGFDNAFSWQVGYHDFDSSTEIPQFRATIRPLTDNEQYNKVPNSIVLYEETGIRLNSVDNLGNWKFPLATNVSIAGGPYRDYQLVIEAHDSQGNTSAGNRVGTSNETNWSLYPYGYDIISIKNPRQTGVELQNNILTLDSGNGNYITGNSGYRNNAYFDPNGGVAIYFTSGTLNPNLAGGYLYTSTGIFPKAEVLTGCVVPNSYWYNQVSKNRFTFDSNNPIVYHQTAGRILNQNQLGNIDNIISGYVSISFYDKLDEITIEKRNLDISSGLYLSYNVPIYKDASVGRLNLGGSAVIKSITYSGISNPIAGWGVDKFVIASGDSANNPGLTTIVYLDMSFNPGGMWSN